MLKIMKHLKLYQKWPDYTTVTKETALKLCSHRKFSVDGAVALLPEFKI